MTGFYGQDYDDDGNPVPDGPDIDGAALLDGVAAFLSVPTVAVPLQPCRDRRRAVRHAAPISPSPFDSTPRLALLSPEKQCGKSRVLELLELLCAGAETLSDASAAYLYRRIAAGQVTSCSMRPTPSGSAASLTRPLRLSGPSSTPGTASPPRSAALR